MKNSIIRIFNNDVINYKVTTIDKLGKDESFFEDVLANNPVLLGLETKSSGIYGAYKIFRQLTFRSPQGRCVYPDILILSQSGHVIIVEVKLLNNPELRDRRVVAQAIEYAAVLSSCSSEDLISIFSSNKQEIESWYDLIESYFPAEDNISDLADTFLERIKNGQVNIIIACDHCPAGLGDIVASVVNQSALDFKLEVKEIVPYQNASKKGDIFFYPNTKYETALISKTAIEITFNNTSMPPLVNINTSSVKDIEENVRSVRTGRKLNDAAKLWTDEETDEYFHNHENPFVSKLYVFSKEHSCNNRVVSPGAKVNPCFGIYVKKGTKERKIYNYVSSSESLTLYFNLISRLVSEEYFSDFKTELKEISPDLDIIYAKEPSIKLTDIEENYEAFTSVILNLIKRSGH